MGIVERQSEFGSQNDTIAQRSQSLAQQLFIVVRTVGRTVNLGRVEKGVTHLHGIGKQFRHLALVGRRTVGMAHAHTAQAHSRHSQSAKS